MTSDEGTVSSAVASDQADTVTATCCGGGRATSGSAVTVAAPCCGTSEAAASDTCCDPDAKTAAVKAGAGCCG